MSAPTPLARPAPLPIGRGRVPTACERSSRLPQRAREPNTLERFTARRLRRIYRDTLAAATTCASFSRQTVTVSRLRRWTRIDHAECERSRASDSRSDRRSCSPAGIEIRGSYWRRIDVTRRASATAPISSAAPICVTSRHDGDAQRTTPGLGGLHGYEMSPDGIYCGRRLA